MGRWRTWLRGGRGTRDDVEVEDTGGLQQFLFDAVAVLFLAIEHEGDKDLEAEVGLRVGRGTMKRKRRATPTARTEDWTEAMVLVAVGTV